MSSILVTFKMLKYSKQKKVFIMYVNVS